MKNLLVGGIPTINSTGSGLARRMVSDCMSARANQSTAAKVVISSNGSVIAQYHADKSFKLLIDQADIVDADGMPLVVASRIFCKSPLPERVATTDFIHAAADAASDEGLRFYFLGGKPGIASLAADRLRERHPNLQIVGTRDGYFSESQLDEICSDIVAQRTDVLWLGLGSPLQEALALKLRGRLPGVGWIKTCGGLFDHCSGSVKRAPGWMQAACLEWLHRMLIEPKRLSWRYLRTNPVACFHLLFKTRDLDPPITIKTRTGPLGT